ncbi:MAG TPA: hypothetical protein VMB21_10115 [Candidatus Limnocylindria bacterium]|jgi:hypothetical protein|nr:hypothetical protein [Candidatus Limnocylindria bacterium]
MKACATHREAVALLASSALGDEESGPLKEHLQACPSCRAYFAEISAICVAHAEAVRALPAAADRPQLYHRVATAIRPSARPSEARGWAALLGRPWQLAGAAGLLLAAVGSWSLLRPAPSPVPLPARSTAASVASPESVGPQFLAYRLALNRSPEAFERLLTAEAAQPSYSSGLPVLRNLAGSDSGF